MLHEALISPWLLIAISLQQCKTQLMQWQYTTSHVCLTYNLTSFFPPLIIPIKQSFHLYAYQYDCNLFQINTLKYFTHIRIAIYSTSVHYRSIIFSYVCNRKRSFLSKAQQGFRLSDFQPSFSVSCLSSLGFTMTYISLHRKCKASNKHYQPLYSNDQLSQLFKYRTFNLSGK